MTAVDRIGSTSAVRMGMRAAAAASPGFLPPLVAGGEGERAVPTGGPALVNLDSLLALQQVDDAGERDRAARRHGQALLVALGRLQRALLSDPEAADSLAELRALAEAAPAAADPELAAAVDMAVLRARIELARHGAEPAR